MATLNERDQHREQRDQLSENRIVADDASRRAPGSYGYGLILVLGLALLAWFAFGTASTVNNSPSVTAPVTSPATPPATPERQPPTNP